MRIPHSPEAITPSFEPLTEEARLLGHDLWVGRIIKTGKEASVYRATLDGKTIALKVYTSAEERGFRSAGRYTTGKYYRNPSERRAAAKGAAFGRREAHRHWVAREFHLLAKAHRLGLSVPEPLLLLSDAVCMEFLGDESMVAPRLHDTALAPDEAKLAYETLMQAISVMWRDMGVAHGDLSPYNILWWHGKPWIIDFPQAVDRRTHPEAHVLLARDIENVSRYFEPYFPADTHALLGSLI